MRLTSVSAVVLALLSAKGATAQAGVYVLFTGASVSTSTTTVTSSPSTGTFTTFTNSVGTKIYGPTFGLYADLPTPVVKLGADVRGSLLNGGGAQLYTGMVGPRVAVALPFISLKPYGEALIGGGNSITKADTNPALRLTYQFVVGVDHKFGPLLEWRILEFSDTHVIVETDTPTKALSTGLVIRIP